MMISILSLLAIVAAGILLEQWMSPNAEREGAVEGTESKWSE